MAKLTRQIDGTYLTEDNKNVGDLDMAYSRGKPQDKANVEYAQNKYGYTPPTDTAGSNIGLDNQDNLPGTPSLTPAGIEEPSNEADIFNLMTRDALLKFQGVNTADLEKKKRALQMAALGKGSEVTPENLRTFSPTQQSQIRSGDVKALQPEFDEVSYQLNKAQQATRNFENVYDKVSKISQDYAEKMVAPDSVIQNYKQLIEADPDNVNSYLSNVNDKTRDAIIQSLDYEKLKPKPDTPSISDQLKAEEAGYSIDDEGKLVPNDLFQEGAIGGQCGDYLHKVADNIPAMGDLFEEKMQRANISTADYEVGDVLIQETNMPYGHVSIVTDVNGDQATVLESNYGLDEKVGKRTIQMGDPSIDGVYRGAELKESESEEGTKFTPEFYATDYGQKVLNNEQQYLTNFQSQPLVKDFLEVQVKSESIKQIVENGVGGPADLALVFEFMKALDPTSVVRESEYDTAAKSGNIFRGWAAKFNGYMKEEGGILPENVKEQFVNLAAIKLGIQQEQYNTLKEKYREIAENQGLNPEHVAPDMVINWAETGDLKSQVNERGYDYDAMIADGYSDEEIKNALNQ